MERARNRPAGMVGFVVVWFGQVVSLLGTAMSNFALTLWAYEVTGRATPLAMIGFFFLAPQVVLGPLVGVLVDRANRKLMMMVSDLAAAVVSATILVLHLTGNLQIWHLYFTATISGIFQGFQWPAYSAAITLMLPKQHYARANGMLEMAGNSSRIFAPILAGALIGPLGLAGILTLDLVAAGVAVGALLVVYVPQPPRTMAGREAAGSFLKEALYGFRYIFARPSLLGLQTVFLVGNLFFGLAYAVIAPLLLGRTGNNELIFGSVQSVSAIGGLAGGLAMSIWGGPKRRVHGVLLGWVLSSLLGQAVLGLGRTLPVWIAGGFLATFFNPIIDGCNQAIWQAKVAPDVQGRVFTARQFIAWLVLPLSQLLAGPLSDRLLEPAMVAGGSLAPTFGWLVGTGTGAGIGLLFVVTGLLAGLVGLAGYLFPAVRNAEDLLPDHDIDATGPGARAAVAG
jgi:DHA3 family macrolide efflux protein-like MFS transporter